MGDRYVHKLSAAPGIRSVHDLASAVEHLRREADVTLRLLSATAWTVLVVDVDGRDAEQIRQDVLERLTRSVGEPGDEWR